MILIRVPPPPLKNSITATVPPMPITIFFIELLFELLSLAVLIGDGVTVTGVGDNDGLAAVAVIAGEVTQSLVMKRSNYCVYFS